MRILLTYSRFKKFAVIFGCLYVIHLCHLYAVRAFQNPIPQ